MKFIKLLAVLFLSTSFFSANAQATIAAQGEVRVTEVKEHLQNGALMIDVREQAEVDALAYDVEGLLHIPMSALEARMNEIPKGKTLIIACRSGNRSRRVASILSQNGYTDVLNLTGGINKWQERGFAVITSGNAANKRSCAGAAKTNCSPSKEGAGKGCCASKAKATSCCAAKAKTSESGGL